MANKIKNVFICKECGNEFPKWTGQCSYCGSWNTIEEVKLNTVDNKCKSSKEKVNAVKLNDIETADESRYVTNISELDRVLGGGIVKGSVVLISGDPGIGKSTLMLQICKQISNSNNKVLYISGEESKRQLKLRANRLGVISEYIEVLSCTDAVTISDYVINNSYSLVIIDSIQTMSISSSNSSPGSVTQIRDCTAEFLKTAKTTEVPFFIVGHVNKDGAIAGPKVLEHIVDSVLYFEGEKNVSYRILRAVKNRFGSTNEIGVFEMSEIGLEEIVNPSESLLEGRPLNVPGSCVACIMEGTRPILTEIQGLVSTSLYSSPRRITNGFDYNRLNMILAVLEKRCGYIFSNLDVYVNVVGGIYVNEPAIDLTVALVLISSLKGAIIPNDTIAFGELGLSGEIRSINQINQRINESIRLGFKNLIVPQIIDNKIETLNKDINLIKVNNIKNAIDNLFN